MKIYDFVEKSAVADYQRQHTHRANDIPLPSIAWLFVFDGSDRLIVVHIVNCLSVSKPQFDHIRVPAIQPGQCRILRYIQYCQLIIFAGQIGQCGILWNIKACQLIILAIQPSQRRILWYIKTCQLITLTKQVSQGDILCHIQCRQLIITAGQIS